MKQQVHPLVALVIVAITLGVVWFLYTSVFSGKTVGYAGPEEAAKAGAMGGATMPPAPPMNDAAAKPAPGTGAAAPSAPKPR